MKKFKKIYIEITNVCNLSCDFCPKSSRPLRFMSKEEFERILIKLRGSSEHLYFHVKGEPLLHPDLGLFLDICQRYGYKVNITTNGTMIDNAADSLMAKPALRQVNFSLHSAVGPGTVQMSQGEDFVNSYLNKIFDFTKKRPAGMLISYRLWNLQVSQTAVPNGTISSGTVHNDAILNRIEEEYQLDFKLKDKLAFANGVKLSEGIYLNLAAAFAWPDLSLNEIGKSGFCHGLRDQAAILVDGTVVPCCLDAEGAVKLGDIFEQEFDDIIQSDRAKTIYEGFSRREAVEPLCRRCGYRMRFSCHGYGSCDTN